MRLLVDENMQAALVGWLREQGHDVLWVAEMNPSTPDSALAERAWREQRVLLSHDTDFGELRFRFNFPMKGVILLRIKKLPGDYLLEMLRRMWPQIEAAAEDNFVTVHPGRLRIRPLDL